MVKKIIFIALGVGVSAYLIRSSMPFGIRNNNPLNIRFNELNDWEGQSGENKGFCVFSSSKYGIRAGAKLIKDYMSSGLTSVSGIIKKWAPNSENPTNSYIDFVSKYLNVNALDNNLNEKNIPSLIKAMIKFENGAQVYSHASIIEGCELAGIKL